MITDTEQTFSENRRYRENLSPKKVAECKGCLSTKQTNTADLQSCVRLVSLSQISADQAEAGYRGVTRYRHGQPMSVGKL